MHLTPDSITEHSEATMPEILARNAEYEALPELTKLGAKLFQLSDALTAVWHVARTTPRGKDRDALLDIVDATDRCPVEQAVEAEALRRAA